MLKKSQVLPNILCSLFLIITPECLHPHYSHNKGKRLAQAESGMKAEDRQERASGFLISHISSPGSGRLPRQKWQLTMHETEGN